MLPSPDETLQILAELVPKLGQALGPTTEVVLHDLRRPDSSLVAISNGDVTGRKVGDSSTNIALEVLKDPFADHDAYHYQGYTQQGRSLKCSSMYFKDDGGRTFAALCINEDISDLMVAAQTLSRLVTTSKTINEQFGPNIEDVIEQLIQEAVDTIHKPVQFMTKEEKIQVVKNLLEQGVFTVRRSVTKVASRLGTSRVTIYGYLNEVRALKDPLGYVDED